MKANQPKYYTLKDIHNLPEGTRAELIDGQIYYMSPSPSRKHQDLLIELSYLIKDYIKKNNGKCKIYPAPFSVYLNTDDEICLEPDISVICDSDKLSDEGCKGAPDWIIEIVSPSNPSRDYVLKLNKYMAAGVREYWIVDPRSDIVTVYFFKSEEFPKNYTFKDKIKVNIYDELEIDFSSLDI